MARFLTGNSVPSYILELPQKVKNSPIASLLAPIIEGATPRGTDIADEEQNPARSRPEEKELYKHFPLKEFVHFQSQIDEDKFIRKISELGEKHKECGNRTLELGKRLVMGAKNSLSLSDWNEVKCLLSGEDPASWPVEDLFPILDAIRMITSGNDLLPQQVQGELVHVLTKLLLKTTQQTSLQLILKILCNTFKKDNSSAVMSKREDLIAACNTVLERVEGLSSVLQIALASLALNFSVALAKRAPDVDQEASVQLVSALCTNFMEGLDSPDALYRSCVALGNLAYADSDAKDLALALDARATISKMKKDGDKLKECTEELKELLAR